MAMSRLVAVVAVMPASLMTGTATAVAMAMGWPMAGSSGCNCVPRAAPSEGPCHLGWGVLTAL